MSELAQLLEADPAAAIRLLNKLTEKNVVPHEGGQREVLDSAARFKVVNCGRRWGKTVVGAKTIIEKTRNARAGSVTWWVAPTYKVVKRGYREVLRQLPEDLLIGPPPPDSHFDAGRSVILRFKNGSQMEFYSAERPAGMLGEGVTFAVLDEAATMPPMVWEQIIRPTLADYRGGAMMISTPRGRNWFYKRWLSGQDELQEDWASWTFPSASNPHLHEDEIEAMRQELPTLIFEQEVLAKFLAAGSSVFRWSESALQYDPILDDGFVDGIAPHGHQFLGIDLAKTTDYTVLYGSRETDRRNTYFERFNSVAWSEQKRRIKRAVSAMRRKGATGVTLIMDSTGVGDPIVEDLEEQGYDVVPINFTTWKAKMVTLLGKDLEVGRAFLLSEAHLSEFEAYAMSATKTGKLQYSAPEGEHDDVVSAKMLSHWGLVNEGAPNIQFIGSESPAEGQYLPDGDSNPSDPGDEDDAEDWSDLLDDDFIEPLDDEGIDYVSPTRVPTAVERLARQPSPEEIFARTAVTV